MSFKDIIRKTTPRLAAVLRQKRADFEVVLKRNRSWNIPEIPSIVMIEPASICNVNCIFCAYRYQDKYRKTGVMSLDLYKKTIHDCKEMGITSVFFSPMCGEIFVNPKMVEFIQIAEQNDIKCGFYTNGVLLDKIDLDALLACTNIKSITISLAPLTSDKYERIYRSGGKYSQLVSGIKKLLSKRNALGISLPVTMAYRGGLSMEEILNCPDMKTQISPLLKMDTIDRVHLTQNDYDTWGGQIKKEDLKEGMHIALPPKWKYRPCAWTKTPMVLWDGRVRACACRFGPDPIEDEGLLVGDITQDLLANIWNGDGFKRVREMFPAKQIPVVCKECTMYRCV